MSEVSPENPFYNVGTVAEMLDVKPYTVRQWIADGAIPARKIQGQWKIQKSDLSEFVNKEYGHA